MIRTIAVLIFLPMISMAEYSEVTAFDRSPRQVFSHDKLPAPENLDDKNLSPFLATGVSVTSAIIPDDDLGDEVIKLDLSETIDIDRFYQINELSAKTWLHFVNSCAKGDSNIAIDKYRDRKICRQSMEEISNFKSELKSFLVPGNFNAYNYSNNWKCQSPTGLNGKSFRTVDMIHCGSFRDWSYLYDEILNTILVGSHPTQQYLKKVHLLSDKLFEQLELPTIHPFLIQNLLEAMASGLAYPYAGWDTPAAGAALGSLVTLGMFRKEKRIYNSRFLRIGMFKSTDDRKLMRWDHSLINAANELQHSNDIIPISEQLRREAMDSNEITENWIAKLEQIRSGVLAEQLMHIISYLEPDFKNWGLWPEDSMAFLGLTAMVQNQKSYSRDDFTTNLRSKLICIRETADQPDVLFPRRMHIRMGLGLPADIEQLQEVGAWRKLWYLK